MTSKAGMAGAEEICPNIFSKRQLLNQARVAKFDHVAKWNCWIVAKFLNLSLSISWKGGSIRHRPDNRSFVLHWMCNQLWAMNRRENKTRIDSLVMRQPYLHLIVVKHLSLILSSGSNESFKPLKTYWCYLRKPLSFETKISSNCTLDNL